MNYNYDYKFLYKLNTQLNVDLINDYCRKNPNSKVLVEIQNTKGLTSKYLMKLNPNVDIRIAGSYDEERVLKYKNKKFSNETAEDYYYNSVIYTRNETIKILEEIEKIESDIDENWSDIQKLVYIYDRLKTTIMYDPKYEQKNSNEIRSLRGLITKKTV